MKKLCTLAALCATCATTTFAAIVIDDGQPVYAPPRILKKGEPRPASFVAPIMSQRPQRIFLLSGPSLGSTNTPAYRGVVMAGIGGLLNPGDRTLNPTAFYPIPTEQRGKGWQLYDSFTSAFPFWNGNAYSNQPPQVAAENGHRIVIPLDMKERVNKYWCRITSSSTNIGTAFFNVATNSAGEEIRFSLQYPAVDFGLNGTLESYQDPVTGQWTQAGDDKVFSNGESPSTNNYHISQRFGATIVNTVTNLSGFDAIKAEFAASQQWLKVELILRDEGDTVVDSYQVWSELPHLAISKSGGNVILAVDQGQRMLLYQIWSATTMYGPYWSLVDPDKFSYGRLIPKPIVGPEMYFRATSVTGF